MTKVYIINTNKNNDINAEQTMLQEEKCAAFYTPWKYYIDTIEANDIVFLYSSGVGIVARGIATGIVEVRDYGGQPDEERYMYLNRFQLLNQPLSAANVTGIIRDVAGADFDIKWNQTMIPIAYNFGIKVWQHITRYCM
ncbi:hypothetical protein BACCIP111895_01959 [Neobacillus rhizosphaerae]|uniref:EVE domain-containing protein n=1 Tax=Neobacillus rhizosphaerae TaxID=2880965 RepID=A0ABN8KMM6_9BACI|nr:hypothetical protein [Neobacillus rhizosphaerae]CAH2714783.1 hypothetical protein BACCIP111895_01959 [Neobacillus rhizosphaerae]